MLPREHGFWAMLLTVLASAVLRAGGPTWSTVGTALGVLTLAVAWGGRYGRRIRRSASAQLVASVALALAGLPVEWVAGVPWGRALATTLVWGLLFLSSSLVVRSAFARVRRGRGARRWHAAALTATAVSMCALSSVFFYGRGLREHALALAVGGLGCALIAAFRPNVKQLKPVGIALASLLVCSGAVLSL